MSDDNREGLIFGLSAVAVSAICAAAIIGIVVLGWAVGGWFQTSSAKRQININNINAHGTRHGFNYQQAQRDAVTSDVQSVTQVAVQMVGQSQEERQALGDQRLSQLGTLCSDAAKVDVATDPLPAGQATFVSANCTAGVINPQSPYETRKDQPTP